MKRVVQKGIAGLGNRFQVLGYCVDIAIANNAKLLVDWRDYCWNDNFSDYFTSDVIDDFKDGTYPDVKPTWWSDKINSTCPRKLTGANFAPVPTKIINSDWKTLVVCQYSAVYSDTIFKNIDFKRRLYDKLRDLEFFSAGYECWHIRATDKTAGDPFAILKQIIAFPTPNYKVIITDNLDIKNEAHKHGIFCQSLIPPVPKSHGIHHSTDDSLRACGITRRILNDSVLVDLLIGKNAVFFHSTCENSSFSQLITRMRNFK